MSSVTSELRAALELVARRPRLPVKYMALLLKVDAGELELRLLAAAHAGYIDERVEGCCHGSRFEITAKGREIVGLTPQSCV